jgi:hypothetical protein
MEPDVSRSERRLQLRHEDAQYSAEAFHHVWVDWCGRKRSDGPLDLRHRLDETIIQRLRALKSHASETEQVAGHLGVSDVLKREQCAAPTEDGYEDPVLKQKVVADSVKLFSARDHSIVRCSDDKPAIEASTSFLKALEREFAWCEKPVVPELDNDVRRQQIGETLRDLESLAGGADQESRRSLGTWGL